MMSKTEKTEHLMIGCGGDLIDMRHKYRVVRTKYAYHFRRIKTAQHLFACLRAGDYAWPGGYDIGYYTSDGATLCPKCVRDNIANIVDSIRTKCDDGWRVDYCDIIYEHDRCDHCGDEVGPEFYDEDAEDDE